VVFKRPNTKRWIKASAQHVVQCKHGASCKFMLNNGPLGPFCRVYRGQNFGQMALRLINGVNVTRRK